MEGGRTEPTEGSSQPTGSSGPDRSTPESLLSAQHADKRPRSNFAGAVRCIDAMDSSFDSVGITVPESLPQEQYKEEST